MLGIKTLTTILKWPGLALALAVSPGLYADDQFNTTRSFKASELQPGLDNPGSGMKRNLLFSGQVRGGYWGGMYHLQYNDFGIGYKGRRLVGGLRVMFSVGSYENTGSLSDRNSLDPAGIRVDRDFRWNDTTLMMSFGKRW